MAQQKENRHSGHRARMRERFFKTGLKGFTEREILELLLFYTIPRIDTKELAKDILKEYKTLANVFDADPALLQEIPGVGENTAMFLTMMPELFRTYGNSKYDKKPLLPDSRALGEYALSMLREKKHEEFVLICLDANRRVHWSGTIISGTVDEVDAYPRLVVAEVLKHGAKTVAFAHNHPGGSMRPSAEDRRATDVLVDLLNSINVEVVDHIIVAGERYYSMSEAGTIF